MAAEQAKLLSGSDEGADALAKLYGSLVGVPTEDVGNAMAVLMNIPEEALSPRDRALRQAAERVAKEVLRKPEPPQRPQVAPVEATEASEEMQAAAMDQDLQDPFGQPQPVDAAPGEAAAQPAAAVPATPSADQADIDPELRTFVDAGRSKLDAIDDLLKKEGP